MILSPFRPLFKTRAFFSLFPKPTQIANEQRADRRRRSPSDQLQQRLPDAGDWTVGVFLFLRFASPSFTRKTMVV